MTCFLSYFPYPHFPPPFSEYLSRERRNIIFMKPSIDFQSLFGALFTSLGKDRNSLHKVKIVRASTTNSSREVRDLEIAGYTTSSRKK